MKIKPTLREKRRYILFKVYGKEEIINDFFLFLKKFFGDFIFSKLSIKIFKIKNKFFILKVRRKFKDYVLMSLLFFKGKEGIIIPIRTFGTLKKVKEYLKKNI